MKSFEKFMSKLVSPEWKLVIDENVKEVLCVKDQRLFNEGGTVDGIYFLNKGKFKIVTTVGGNEKLLRLSSNGDFAGHRAISSKRFPISAIALTDGSATFIPISLFKKLILNNPKLAMYVINYLAEDLKKSEELMKSMIHNDVIIRIGKIICLLIDAFGFENNDSKKLTYSMSRTDIASFVGSSYEGVIRNLARLDELGLIKLDNKAFIILKEKELRALVRSK